MANREREKKKKRAYLDDFEKDLNGNYQYRGAHYRYAGEPPHSRVLALLWLFCGGGAALTVGAGALPDDAAEFAAEFAARRAAEAASAPRRPDLSRAARAPEENDGEKKEADHDNG